MTTISLEQSDLPRRLLVLLSRWSLVTALLIFVSIASYSAAASAGTDKALGRGYAVLTWAVRNPVLYRLATVSEALYWLMIGGTLIIYAGLFGRRAPIRAGFIAVCGLAQLIGSDAAFLLGGYSDLAARYATAAPDQKAALLQSFLDL